MAKGWERIAEDAKVLLEQALYDTADAMIRYMESSDVIPVDTHNLKDSTGIGVYIDGVLKRFQMNPKAEVPKDGLWGKDMIVHALMMGETKYSKGCCIVLFSTMPYAGDQDEEGRNAGYFSDLLVSEFKDILDEVMKRYATERN